MGQGPDPDAEIPPVPLERIEWGAAWADEWARAHREMAMWRRTPSIHLIDNITNLSDRVWLRDYYAELAGTTHRPGGTLQDDGRCRWIVSLKKHDTMGDVDVKVVLESDGTQIVTAYPL